MSKRAALIKTTKESLATEDFVKLVLSKPIDSEGPKKVTARQVQIKGEDMLSLVSSFATKDVTKNHLVADALPMLLALLDTSFENAALFTLENNYQLEKTASGKDKIHTSAPTTKSAPSKDHNYEKKRLIGLDRPFLTTLGIVSPSGEIKTKLTGKYQQIESFITILSNTIGQSRLSNSKEISVYDMGAGSAYVSFAIYEYLHSTLQKTVQLTGVDIHEPLMERNNLLASELGFTRMAFEASSISDLGKISADIVVALHACNTATDDALFAGIQAEAEVIIVSPCCHQELRSKMSNPDVLTPMLKFGTYKEKSAEMLTDTIRTLVLEIHGYKTNLFEFVSDEHSGKNNIIVAVKKQSNQDAHKFITQLVELKKFYGLTDPVHLESLLENA